MCSHKDTSLHQWGVKNIRCLKKNGSTFDELMWIRFFFPRTLEVRAGVRFRPVSILQENPN